jgi:hypothetical protein
MAFLLFFTAFVLSGIAAYYSVIGLIAIFSAAVLPVAIMGGSLEAAKLVVASWLYRYWKSIPFLMKAYFTSALVILMIITSMGIFGFLSKAHSDQSLVSGDVTAKIAVYDEKIKTAKENIDANRRALKQMDEAVDQVMGRSTDEKGADKAVAIRRAQQKERGRLLAEIEAYQKTVSSLNEERAPIAAEVRKVEAEVGPLKYIAAMIYGDNPDENSLERSVRWLIILLIAVFDPLAVLMLIAANLTQIKQKEWQAAKEEHTPVYVADVGEPPTAEEKAAYEADDGPLTDEQINQIKESVDPQPIGRMFDRSSIVKNQPEVEETILDKHPYLSKPFVSFENTQPMVAPKEPESKIEEVTHDDMEQSKDTTNEVVLPVAVEEPTRTPEDNRQDASTGFIAKPAMETVGIEEPVKKTRRSKKKPEVEQVTEDKSSSVSIEDQVNTMIENNDTTGLESIYKQIVKELATKNRNKSTHWGPLKTKK